MQRTFTVSRSTSPASVRVYSTRGGNTGRQVKHTSLVDHARTVVTATTGGPAGYGFQYERGSVLPEVVGSPVVSSPTHLLRWSAEPVGRPVSELTTFVCATDDYYAAPRTPVVDSLRPTAGAARTGGGGAQGAVRRGCTARARHRTGDRRRVPDSGAGPGCLSTIVDIRCPQAWTSWPPLPGGRNRRHPPCLFLSAYWVLNGSEWAPSATAP